MSTIICKKTPNRASWPVSLLDEAMVKNEQKFCDTKVYHKNSQEKHKAGLVSFHAQKLLIIYACHPTRFVLPPNKLEKTLATFACDHNLQSLSDISRQYTGPTRQSNCNVPGRPSIKKTLKKNISPDWFTSPPLQKLLITYACHPTRFVYPPINLKNISDFLM